MGRIGGGVGSIAGLAAGIGLALGLACGTGADPGEGDEAADGAPDEASDPDPREAKRGKRGKRGKGKGKGKAKGAPDPLAGLSDREMCKSDALLLLLYPYEDLQGGKCGDVCCESDPEHWCCDLDWPFSDVPSCDAYARMRNEIFARYGYPFTDPKWRKEFEKAPYYKRREDFDSSWLTPMATRNVATLKDLEEKHVGCTP